MTPNNATGDIAELDPVGVRRAYDTQVRRGPDSEATGVVVDVTSRLARWTATNHRGWSEIAWSKLDAACAEEVIAAQISYVAEREQSFVWRLYDYDQPSDLGPASSTPGSPSTATPPRSSPKSKGCRPACNYPIVSVSFPSTTKPESPGSSKSTKRCSGPIIPSYADPSWLNSSIHRRSLRWWSPWSTTSP
jgi:hypothetical protein